MSKQDDANFLKIQTCILKVPIHCDGCKQKVKKLLQQIDGVYTVTIDGEQGNVCVSGNVDPKTLIKRLSKSGKHAELISPKINSNNPKQQQQQRQAVANNSGKGQQSQKVGNGINGGGGGKDKNAQTPSLQQQQKKGFSKYVNLPQFAVQKDSKPVKFSLPPEDESSEFDDEFDDEDEDEDDLDGFDEDFNDKFKNLKTNTNSTKPANDGTNVTKSGGNQKKAEIPVQVKGVNGNNSKKGGSNGKNDNGGGGRNNVGGKGQPQMGQMGPPKMENMPPQTAVQGLPPGYFDGQVAAANPYQQQEYMQAVQQQRMMMMMNGQDQMYPMMGYPRPPPYAMYMQPPLQNVHYTDYFSEENPSSCSIM